MRFQPLRGFQRSPQQKNPGLDRGSDVLLWELALLPPQCPSVQQVPISPRCSHLLFLTGDMPGGFF